MKGRMVPQVLCKNEACGKAIPVPKTRGRGRPRAFCSDACRVSYWNAYQRESGYSDRYHAEYERRPERRRAQAERQRERRARERARRAARRRR